MATPKNPGPIDPVFEPPEALRELIKKDEKHAETWDEILDKKVRKDEWYKFVEEVTLSQKTYQISEFMTFSHFRHSNASALSFTINRLRYLVVTQAV